MSTKATVADIIVDRIISRIEQGGKMPWDRPFQAAAINWFSKHEYRGINQVLLGGGEFITKKQIEQYNEKHGTRYWFESGTPSEIVVFYSRVEKKISPQQASDIINKGGAGTVFPKDDGSWVKLTWLLKYYTVYNIKYLRNVKDPELLKKPEYKDGIFQKREVDIRGKTRKLLVMKSGEPALKEGITKDDFEVLEPKLGTSLIEEHTDAETIIQTYMNGVGVKLRFGEAGAWYSDMTDTVATPDKKFYKSQEAYYRTLFHEFIHSTGIKRRLDRKCFVEYHNDKKTRGKEELIAEVGALLLASEAGFRDEGYEVDNSVEYIAGWCRWMKDNPQEVVQGFFAAEKAKNYILSGGAVKDASSSVSIDNPKEGGEDANVDTDTVEDEGGTSDSSDSTSSPNGKPKPDYIKYPKTKKALREFIKTELSSYYDLSDEEKASILVRFTMKGLGEIYKTMSGKSLPSTVRKKDDAVKMILGLIGI